MKTVFIIGLALLFMGCARVNFTIEECLNDSSGELDEETDADAGVHREE